MNIFLLYSESFVKYTLNIVVIQDELLYNTQKNKM